MFKPYKIETYIQQVLLIASLCIFGTIVIAQETTPLPTSTPTPIVEQTLTIFDMLAEPIEGYGTVSIKQDERLVSLLNNHKALNIQNESKIQGWRVQIYNSSGVDSRKEAEDIRRKFLERYPDATVYVIYQPPFFKIRVGDFRTREDAYMLYKQIVQDFPISYLVNDIIQLPKL